MNALIIDDSELDRLNLSTLLSDHSEITILGEAHNLKSALEQIHALQPDLIFLDVHLGKEKGFRVLDDLQNPPKVVLTTAHPQYALEGFDVDAVDYILKPVTEENLARSVERLKRRAEAASSEDQLPQGPLTVDSPLFFKDKQEHCIHPVSEVALITTDRPYSIIHIRNGSSYYHRRSLKEWKETLPKERFLALDRSIMVNIHEVEKLTPLDEKYLLHFKPEAIAPLTIGANAFKVLRDSLYG